MPKSISTDGPLGDEQGVVAGLGELGEEVAHLGRRLQVVLLALELEPLGVVDEGTGLHAQQRVVGHMVLAVGVVAVVGGEQGCADAVGDLDQRRVGLVLLGQAVVLDLDEQVALAEDVLESTGQHLGLDLVVGQQGLEHDAAEAAGGGDEALGVALEQLPVEPGLVVVALEVGGRRQLEEVAVALVRLGQEGQVVVELLAPAGVATGVVDLAPADRTLVAGLGGHVGLGADDRVDAGLAARRVEVEDPVHVPVVGDPEGRLAVGHGRLDEVVHPRRPVQHRELGVGVEVGERPCCQRLCVPFPVGRPAPWMVPRALHRLWTSYSSVIPTIARRWDRAVGWSADLGTAGRAGAHGPRGRSLPSVDRCPTPAHGRRASDARIVP